MQTSWTKTCVAACLALSVNIVPSVASAAEDKDVVAYRQHVMRALDAQTAAVGMVLSGVAPEENLVSHLEAIAVMAGSAAATFEAKVPGGESSPDVWTKWPDFSQRMKAFADGTAKAAKTAREQGKDAVMSEIATALSCKSCHDLYRLKK